MSSLPIQASTITDIASQSSSLRTSSDESSQGDFHATLAREMGVTQDVQGADQGTSTSPAGEKSSARNAHRRTAADAAATDGGTTGGGTSEGVTAMPAQGSTSTTSTAAKPEGGDARTGDTAAGTQPADPAAAAQAIAAAANAAARPETPGTVKTDVPGARAIAATAAPATTAVAERPATIRGQPLQANSPQAGGANAGQDATGSASDIGSASDADGTSQPNGAVTMTNFADHLLQARDLVGTHRVAESTPPAGAVPQADQNAVAQATTEPPPAPVAPTSSTLAEPFGSARWGDAFAQKVVLVAGSDSHSAELQLNPPDLGPVQVVIDVQKDQASAWFTSPDPGVRQAIEDSLPRLREMMAQSGIRLDNASVGSESRNSSGGSGGQRSTPSWGRDSTISAGISAPAAVRRTVANGLVDTFA